MGGEKETKQVQQAFEKGRKLATITNVVTGKHSKNECTSPGVWYILYIRLPYTLKCSAVGKADYSVKVDYWTSFTDSGQITIPAGERIGQIIIFNRGMR